MHPRRKNGGFALAELATVIAILGLLALTLIPSFLRYARRSRTTEAVTNLRKLFDAEVSYYETQQGFPYSQAFTPAQGTCCTQTGRICAPEAAQWQTSTWAALFFAVDDPHYFSYQVASGVGNGKVVNDYNFLQASADLDCDGNYSLYQRAIRIDGQSHAVPAGRLYVVNDME